MFQSIEGLCVIRRQITLIPFLLFNFLVLCIEISFENMQTVKQL